MKKMLYTIVATCLAMLITRGIVAFAVAASETHARSPAEQALVDYAEQMVASYAPPTVGQSP